MRTESRAYSNSTLQALLSIDEGEYKQKIRFVEKNWSTVRNMPVEEYAAVLDTYAEALFATGKFIKHIEVADHLVELAIVQNVKQVNGRDLFFETLFRKAASLYNLNQLDESIHVLQELLKIDSNHESTRLFLINCYIKKQSPKLRTLRKISVVTILLSAVVIAVELLLINTVAPSLSSAFETTRNTMFISGVIALVAGEAVIRYRAVSHMYAHVKD